MSTTATVGPHDSPTFEGIADGVVDLLRRRGWLRGTSETPWEGFLRLSATVHRDFEVPSSTFSPMMRRLLFALTSASRPRVLVGAGTFVGYTFAWLLGDRKDVEVGPLFDQADGIDIDPVANVIARRNCQVLSHGTRLRFRDADAVTALRRPGPRIDLLYIDVDEEVCGKLIYRDVLESARPRLRSGALILAHDPCVPKFKKDFEVYHAYVGASPELAGPLVLPVDPCGLSIAVVKDLEACDGTMPEASRR